MKTITTNIVTTKASQLLLTLILAVLFPVNSWSQDSMSTTSTLSGDYIVHHSVFNSSFLTPDIASIYGFTRGADKALVNVAVTKADAGGASRGLPADVSGIARNLMQQQTPLEFVAIEEADAVYYIAPFEFDDEEILHFDIEVSLPDHIYPKKIRLTKKLYHD